MNMIRKTIRATYLVFYGIAFFLVFGAVLFGLAQHWQHSIRPDQSQPDRLDLSSVQWYFYTNDDFGFSIHYPTDWTSRAINYGDEQRGQLIFQSADFEYEIGNGIVEGARFTIHIRGETFSRFLLDNVPDKKSQLIGENQAFQWFASGGLGSAPDSDLLVIVVEHGQYEYYIECDYSMAKRADALRICEYMLGTMEFQAGM